MFGSLQNRIVTVLAILLLMTGGPACAALSVQLRLAAPSSSRIPTEEDEGHGKGKQTAVEQRFGPGPRPRGHEASALGRPLAVPSALRPSTCARSIPDRGADLRNGLGAPLRC
jgi:hypothetical protein